VKIDVPLSLLAASTFFNSTSKSAATTETGGSTYLLYRNGGRFVIGKEEAASLSEVIYGLGSAAQEN